MDTVKVYENQTIADLPFPQEQQAAMPTTGSGSGVFSNERIPDEGFPEKRIATEVIGEALNTRSQKILAEFGFTPSGAIQIGTYQNGVSGDIRISPSGIVARNISGLVTFTLDGDTGDAVFKGTVQASRFVSESLITGLIDVGLGTGYVRLDGDKNRIVVHDGTNPRIVIGNV